MANTPVAVKAHFYKIESLGQQIKTLGDYVDQETRRVKDADASTPTGASGSPQYVDEVMRQRSQVNRDINAIREKRQELEEVSREYLKEGRASYKEFAMFTGNKYAGYEIWDCGSKSD